MASRLFLVRHARAPWLRLAGPSLPLCPSSRASFSAEAAQASDKEEQKQQLQVHAEGKALLEIRQQLASKAAELASLKSEIELMDAEISRLRELRRLPSASVELPKKGKPSPRNNAQAAIDSIEGVNEEVDEEVDKEEEEEEEDEDSSQVPKNRGLEHASSSPDQATTLGHPWLEWVAFLEELEKRGYAKTDKVVEDDSRRPLVERAGLIRRMTNEFSRDRDDIVRFLSRKHIKVIANYGCPSTDSKVVNAGKRLRKDCALSEGDVCLKCNLKRSCTKAYAEILPHRAAETVDVVRFLLGFTWTMSSDTKGAGVFPKEVGSSIGALLKELLECMQKPRDPNLPRLSMETTRPRIGNNSGDSLSPKGRFNKSKERSHVQIDSEDDDGGSFRRDSSDLARFGRYGKGDSGRKREMKPRLRPNNKDGYMGNRNRVSFESSNSSPPMREKEQHKGKVRKADEESEDELDLSEDDDELDDSFKPKNNSRSGGARRQYKIIDTSGLQDDEDGFH